MRSPLLAAFALLANLAWAQPDTTLLDEYVHRPEPVYKWELYHKESGLLAKYYFLSLTSQQWLDSSKVDRPVWTHEIKISQPRPFFCGKTAKTSPVALLVISGGKNRADGSMSKEVPPFSGTVAKSFCRTVVELRQVPNQPLTFIDETSPRKEDGLIAYSFDRFLKGESGDWPVQLAMVKSVVQAMNAVQEFSRTRDDIPDIDSFVLLGASKRGWTTWLTAAVDPRVKAIVPVSIDMLDLEKQFPHHFASYGGYAPALREYQAFDIATRMHTARGGALRDIVDPIVYLKRLQQPKLILNSAGDEFFVTDSWRFYYNRLEGDNRLRYTVNSDHRQGGGSQRYQLILQARNWVNDVIEGREPPSISWQRGLDGALQVKATQKPTAVRLWTADNPQARDFRLETLGAAWQSKSVQAEKDSDTLFRVPLDTPTKGWRAALVEVEFEVNGETQTYTTGVYVLPDAMPFQAQHVSAPAAPVQ